MEPGKGQLSRKQRFLEDALFCSSFAIRKYKETTNKPGVKDRPSARRGAIHLSLK